LVVREGRREGGSRTHSLSCLEFVLQGVDLLLQVLDLRLLHPQHHLEDDTAVSVTTSPATGT